MRLRRLSCVKIIVFASTVILFMINISHYGGSAWRGEENSVNVNLQIVSTLPGLTRINQTAAAGGGGQDSNIISADSLAGSRVHGLPNNTNDGEESREDRYNSSSATILAKIHHANKEQVINNSDLFGEVTNNTIVIVIQVHDRLEYLRQLIKSFSVAAGIDQALLIFSHDVWDSKLNNLIRSIDFCQTLQIFYPLSLQTHRGVFPGESPQDCPRDGKKEGKTLSCTNYHWPDIHGHYREAQYTQTKHHWWWKANHVFHGINLTQDFTGLFLFLEEDHYVSEDFLHVLKLMDSEKKKSFPKVDILCLGTYLKKFNFRATGQQSSRLGNKNLSEKQRQIFHKLPVKQIERSSHTLRRTLSFPLVVASFTDGLNKAEITEWISAKHNMGMAFTRKEWNKMVACTDLFCKYDDYNWDWSLQHVSLNCMKEKMQVMLSKGPRVFHIGECGVHHKKSNCNSSAVSEKVKKIIKSAKSAFFPQRLLVSKSTLKKKQKIKKANGGWGDIRDHQLCKNFTSDTYM